MNCVLLINVEDLIVMVELGIMCKVFNEVLCDIGLFFLIDLGVDVSIGGMIVICVLGINVVCYGMMCENVFGLIVVFVDGCVVKIGLCVCKLLVGYDFMCLFVGFEGMFGVIIEIMLCLYLLFEVVLVVICMFLMMGDVVCMVIEMIQIGVLIVCVEFVDVFVVCLINCYLNLMLIEVLMLFFEFYGIDVGVKEQVEFVQVFVGQNVGQGFEWVICFEDCMWFWFVCYNVYFVMLQLKFGCCVVMIDVCVLILQFVVCVEEIEIDLCVLLLFCLIVGYVGDGNFYVVILIDFDKFEEFVEVEYINDWIVECVLCLGGICMGEYGVGLYKMCFLLKEYGDNVIDMMCVIKFVFDLCNLMNLGKIFMC